MNADDEAAALLEQLVAVGTPRRAEGEKAYLKSQLEHYGVSVPVFNEVEWASSEAIVPGLRENDAFRASLALANPEPKPKPARKKATGAKARAKGE